MKVGSIIYLGDPNSDEASLKCAVNGVKGHIIDFTVINGAWDGCLNVDTMMLTCYHTGESFKMKYFTDGVPGY